MDSNTIWFALLLTIFAGISTSIGSLIAFLYKKPNNDFLAIALSFSAGVMIYVSFVEIFPISLATFKSTYGETKGIIYNTIAFFSGIFLIGLIDKFVPSYENPHEINNTNISEKEINHGKIKRLGIMSAIAITIHNFPEGIATFASAIKDPTIGVSIAIAVAIHNIPEGIAVSVPIYFSTKSKKKAFIYSSLSGLSEPLGALTGLLFLQFIYNDAIFSVLFSMVAGIMVFISLDGLLPFAFKNGKHHLSVYGLIIGMIIMALSLILFK